MGEFTCKSPLMPGIELSCGGNGLCNQATGLCDCVGFWSGKSDFITTSSFDCGVNTAAVRGLWAINVFVIIFVNLKCFGIIMARTESFLVTKKEKKDYSLWSNKGLLAVYVSFLWQQPFQFALGVLKIVDPTRQIGFDPLATSFFVITRTGFYVAVSCYQPALLAVVMKGIQRKEFERLLSLNQILTVSIQVFAILMGVISVVETIMMSQSPGYTSGVFTQQEIQNQISFARAYYFGQGISLFANATLSLIMSIKIGQAMDKSINLQATNDNKEKMATLKARMNAVQSTVKKQGYLQGTLLFIFFGLDRLWNKHDYLLPISWILFSILCRKIAEAVNLDKFTDKSVMARLRKKFGFSSNGATSDDKEFTSLTKTQQPQNTIVIGGSIYPESVMGVASITEDGPGETTVNNRISNYISKNNDTPTARIELALPASP